MAAILSGKLDLQGKKVVCLLSGGNIDVGFVQGIIERGLVARSRRLKFTVKLVDKPGSLVRMLTVLADSGANVLTVQHDKLRAGLNPNETTVHVACEVGGAEHGEAALEKLREEGFQLLQK